jgi:hypothetical protein
MSRKKSNKEAPAWAVDDNPYSKYGFIYVDMLKSEKYQALSRPAQHFYLVCIANSHDDKARACLKNHVLETNRILGKDESIAYAEIDHYLSHGYFVFPASQLKQYGYTRGYGWKLMHELIEAGFVRIKEQNKVRLQVNVYQFSASWKKQNPVPPPVDKKGRTSTHSRQNE